jgi:hypothetical protein
MRNYQVSIVGTQALLLHADNIEWADQMEDWRSSKDNKKISKAGDDRSPAWRWLGTVYHDDQHIVMPADNIMRALLQGGAMVPVPGGKNGKTFKSQSQSGILPKATAWPLLLPKSGTEWLPIPWPSLAKLTGEKDFSKHKEAVVKVGGELFTKRVKIGQAKHIRVRPRFSRWMVVAEFGVSDEQITTEVLTDIVEMAGHYVGLGDWRPGGKTPGSYGMFGATVKQLN